MELFMPTGKKTEKEGTLLSDVSRSIKNTDLETLKQTDGKIDTLLEKGKVEIEEKV